jgi:YidC/Oxa1 family membrane protein insertase
MEKRVFIAIFLSLAVLTAYQFFLAPKTVPPPSASETAPKPPDAAAAATNVAPTAPAAAIPAGPAPLVADTEAHDVVVETNDVVATFSTKGAVLRSWRLKHYFDSNKQPLELVPQQIPDAYPRPLRLSTDDAGLSATLGSALYRPSVTSLSLGSSEGTLSFVYQDAAGLNAHKTFLFQPGGKAYIVKVDASVDVSGRPQPTVLAWGPALGLGYNPDGSREVPRRAIQMRDKVERLTASNLEKQSSYEGTFRFAGVEDQYFLTVSLPSSPLRVDYQAVTLPVPGDAQHTRAFIGYSVRSAGAVSLPFYFGPKDFDSLHAVDPELTYAIDFGFFRPLVVPLLQSLKWINRYLGNYGWSIIALTVFINLVIFPLRHRSMVSMRKMQAIQPEVKAIQDRYAKYKITDPERQKMNTEMMALYKQRGVNPASGCVPMLLTMPVLFAFYAMLSASIELRGAPFFGWLHDLSLKDPTYITPIVMGATMFWQQRMMPSTTDPAQQRMLMLMPLVFTFMFVAAPAGLVIYWLASNLLAIGQQYLTNRLIGAPVRPAKAVVPRAAKTNGAAGSKTQVKP